MWLQARELSVGGFGDGALPSMAHLGPDSAELAAACCVQQREGHVQVMLTATCVVNASQVAQTLSPALGVSVTHSLYVICGLVIQSS